MVHASLFSANGHLCISHQGDYISTESKLSLYTHVKLPPKNSLSNSFNSSVFPTLWLHMWVWIQTPGRLHLLSTRYMKKGQQTHNQFAHITNISFTTLLMRGKQAPPQISLLPLQFDKPLALLSDQTNSSQLVTKKALQMDLQSPLNEAGWQSSTESFWREAGF